MNKRLIDIRKALNLNQESFGKRLGVGASAISRLEKGDRNITEQMFISICREFNINGEWLRTGQGEMFAPVNDFYYDLGYYTKNASDLDKAIIIELLKMDQNTKQAMLDYWKNVIAKLDNN